MKENNETVPSNESVRVDEMTLQGMFDMDDVKNSWLRKAHERLTISHLEFAWSMISLVE